MKEKIYKVKVLGTGSYIPEKVLSNKDLEKMVDTSDEWITTRTGIKKRHIAKVQEAASDLAYYASQEALKSSGLKPKELDMIIVATITPDMIFPATACVLQNRLGARHIPAFDLEAACSGFLYALTIGERFVESGEAKYVLVVASEILSRILDWKDRTTCVIFADGAGAAILGPSSGSGKIISSYLGADGGGADLVYVPAGGSRLPATHRTVEERLHYMKMRGNELFKRAVKEMLQAMNVSLKKAKLSFGDIDLFIPHQANLRIIKAVAERAGLPMEKVFINLDECGNMSAASIAVGLDQAVKRRKVKEGDIILLTSFGGGLTWGSLVIEW